MEFCLSEIFLNTAGAHGNQFVHTLLAYTLHIDFDHQVLWHKAIYYNKPVTNYGLGLLCSVLSSEHDLEGYCIFI